MGDKSELDTTKGRRRQLESVTRRLRRLRRDDHLLPAQQVLLDDVLADLAVLQALAAHPGPEREFEALAEYTPDVVVRLGRDQRYLYVNAAFEEAMGLPSHAVLGKSNRDLPVPSDLCALGEHKVAKVLEAGAQERLRFSFVVAGQERYYQAHLAPEPASDGAVESVLVVVRDITEQERAWQALRRYAKRLQFLRQVDRVIQHATLAEEAAEAILPYSRQILPCSRASVALFDRERGEAVLLAVLTEEETLLKKGRSFNLEWGWFLDELARGQVCAIDDLSSLASPAQVIQTFRAEGIRSLVGVPLIVHGELIGSLNLGLDKAGALTSEQKEIAQEMANRLAVAIHQAQLREQAQDYTADLEQSVARRTAALYVSQARFRTIFESAAIGIALMDTDGHVLTSNPALQEMLGYTASELEGLHISRFIHPDDRGRRDELFQELVAGERNHFKMEKRYVRRDGTTIWVRPTVSLVRTPQGTVRHAIKMVEDITEQRRAQEKLIQAERLTLAGRLGASLAHEINNPLQSVIGSLGLVEEMTDLGDEIQLYLQIALEELERAAGIVTQLRDLNRGSEPGTKEPTQLNGLVEKVLKLNQKQCEGRQITVDWNPAADLPLIDVVPDRMRQVFLNLTLNAIEAMPDGGRLQVSTTWTCEPEGIRITFADTGTGIDPEFLPLLFEPFQSTRPEGLGLGLYISKTIVEQHAGRIEADSPSGEGTTFTVWLPGQA